MSLNSEPDTVFFDDFNRPALDRSAWNVRVTGVTVNEEQQAYVDSEETISLGLDGKAVEANGVLIIQPRFRPGFLTPEGRRFDFISGRIDTRERVQFTYGTVEARIMVDGGAGLWPAFWALGAEGQWPDSGEIDIMENVGEPDWVSAALHGPGVRRRDGAHQPALLPAGRPRCPVACLLRRLDPGEPGVQGG